MSELTRIHKVDKLFTKVGKSWVVLAEKTDQEINNLYEEHFEKITKEDFEGFEKVMSKFGFDWCENLSKKEGWYINDIKKELGL